MKNMLLAIFVSLFFAGCATKENTSFVLYKNYSQYENNFKKDNIIDLADNFFSQSLLGADYKTNPDAANQLLFKNYMTVKDSHHEKINSQDGCLVVNGYDKEGAPLIFSLKYVSVNNRWLIDDIHVVFIETPNDFSGSAKCPTEYAQ